MIDVAPTELHTHFSAADRFLVGCATIFADSTAFFFTSALALIDTVSGKWGNGLRSFANSASSWKLWPEPANKFVRVRRIDCQRQLLAFSH